MEINTQAPQDIDCASFDLAALLPKTWTFPVPLLPAVFLSFQEV